MNPTASTHAKAFVSLIVLLVGIAPVAAYGRSHSGSTATPIQHLVIIFQENVSFDHYFGTYPHATNPANEPPFYARRGTPTVNGFTPALLSNNPNLNPLNGTGATNPFRLDRSQAVTADQDHDYQAEQQAFDMGALDCSPSLWERRVRLLRAGASPAPLV